jgi:hypothetical protein
MGEEKKAASKVIRQFAEGDGPQPPQEADEDGEKKLGFDDGDDDSDDTNEDDDDDGEGDDEEDPTLRDKIELGLEPNSVLTAGRVIIQRDPKHPERVLISARVDDVFDEKLKADGTQMWEATLVVLLHSGFEHPKRRIINTEDLSLIFNSSNWKKRKKRS